MPNQARVQPLKPVRRSFMTRLLHLFRPMILGRCCSSASRQLCGAYSVLTHEEVVDLLWKDDIQPLLAKRFPDATADDLKKAHAFAYGGSLVQDMGYYPFGNKYFSDLTHYVRSGDFIVNMINESSDLNEYAFALGALAHYSADNLGHPDRQSGCRAWSFRNCEKSSAKK